MQVTRLDIGNLRRFEQTGFAPGAGLNLITGANGAGKTSVLEALHLMAYGRSFRGRVGDGLVRSGSEALEVFVAWHAPTAEATTPAPREHKAGLRHSGQAWEGRLDGVAVQQLGDLCAALAVVTIEPGSHALIMGPAEGRRRFMDWGLFHVEPRFVALWRRYARALKQRNALLKARSRDAQIDAWEQEMGQAGDPITAHRRRYLEQLHLPLQSAMELLFPSAGEASLVFLAGWRHDEMPLVDALLLSRERDFALGFTSVGPHRAHWRIDQAGVPGRHALSRGQAKLTAVSTLLAQAELHANLRGDWPVIGLDDLPAELDLVHQRRVVARLRQTGAQVFLTATETPAALAELDAPIGMFHVEHGQIHG